MVRSQYHETRCKTALNRVRNMPFKWSLNPYVGCAHRCRYCYARAFYERAGHGDAGLDFETRILVKVNLPDVLARELSRPSWRGEQVALGSATDCYQPAEGRYRLTRQVLELLLRHRNPVGLVTKSTLVLRDQDVLGELARVAKVRIFFTITTLEHDVWRRLEPGTPPPLQRFRVLRALSDAGVPCGVLLAPILPRITDSVESIEAVAAAAADHGAIFFGATALRLSPAVREYYLAFIDASYPSLSARYQRAYESVNAPKEYLERLDERVQRIRERFGFDEDSMRKRQLVPSSSPEVTSAGEPKPAQLALPL